MSKASGHLPVAFAACLAFLLWTVTATAQSSQAQPRPKRPIAGPEVTAVQVRPIKTRVGQPCPGNFAFYGAIYTNGKTTVTYQWVGSGGKTWPQRNLKFAAAGVKSVNQPWRLGAPGEKVDKWMELQILDPNRMTSNRVTLDFTCGGKPQRHK